jgi:hypothetical protein
MGHLARLGQPNTFLASAPGYCQPRRQREQLEARAGADVKVILTPPCIFDHWLSVQNTQAAASE